MSRPRATEAERCQGVRCARAMLSQIEARTGELPATVLADANHEAITTAIACGVETPVPVPSRTRASGPNANHAGAPRPAAGGARAQGAVCAAAAVVSVLMAVTEQESAPFQTTLATRQKSFAVQVPPPLLSVRVYVATGVTEMSPQ